MPARQVDFFAALFLLAVCSATVWAEGAPSFVPEKLAAIATDEPTTPTPADVAREVVRLQEEMGGSIVRDFGEVPPWAPAQPHPPHSLGAAHPHRPAFKSPVAVLREVSWQLDQSAHLLESLDLYDQADALRETANSLRKDARRMKEENVGADEPSD